MYNNTIISQDFFSVCLSGIAIAISLFVLFVQQKESFYIFRVRYDDFNSSGEEKTYLINCGKIPLFVTSITVENKKIIPETIRPERSSSFINYEFPLVLSSGEKIELTTENKDEHVFSNEHYVVCFLLFGIFEFPWTLKPKIIRTFKSIT